MNGMIIKNFFFMIYNTSINLVNLNFNYFKYLPKRGFISIRFSYLVIFILSFIAINNFTKKTKPDIIAFTPSYLIASYNIKIIQSFHTNLY